jgi:ketosteroid isomerase-like protein
MSPFCEEPSTVTDQTTLSPTRTLDLVHQAYNAGDMDLAASLVAPGAVDHGAADGTVPGTPEHVRGWDRRRRAFRSSVPDLAVTVERSVENGDTVGQLMTARGTMNGTPFMGSGIHVVRVREGKVVEHWAAFGGRAADQVVSPGPAEVLRRATEAFLAGFPEGRSGFVSPDAVDHTFPGEPVEAWEERRRALRGRMSDVSVSVLHCIEAGDTVAQLIETRGTLDGRPFQSAGFHIVRVRGGEIAEHWAVAQPFA